MGSDFFAQIVSAMLASLRKLRCNGTARFAARQRLKTFDDVMQCAQCADGEHVLPELTKEFFYFHLFFENASMLSGFFTRHCSGCGNKWLRTNLRSTNEIPFNFVYCGI